MTSKAHTELSTILSESWCLLKLRKNVETVSFSSIRLDESHILWQCKSCWIRSLEFSGLLKSFHSLSHSRPLSCQRDLRWSFIFLGYHSIIPLWWSPPLLIPLTSSTFLKTEYPLNLVQTFIVPYFISPLQIHWKMGRRLHQVKPMDLEQVSKELQGHPVPSKQLSAL